MVETAAVGSMDAKITAKTAKASRPPRPTSDNDEVDDGWWRVLLLRSLIHGDLAVVERLVLEHIDALSAPFTNAMPPWKLQWESIHWWLFQDATPLCVASMYAHPALVDWLLRHGADRTTPCYLHQTALAYVGECCEHMAGVAAGSRAKDSVECTRLLQEPPALPLAPSDDVVLSSSVATEFVLVRSPSPAATPMTPTRSSVSRGTTPATPAAVAAPPHQQRIYKCLVHVAWRTPLSNGALIDKYEVRYRAAAATDDDGDDDSISSNSSNNPTDSWRVERATHNRKSCEQQILLHGLQFHTVYEVTLRSWNVAGRGEWSRNYKLETCTSPEQQAQQTQ